MSKSRAKIFGDDDTTPIDVTSFAPKVKPDPKAPAAEEVREVSKAANFTSREPTTSKPSPKKDAVVRRYRTGRNVQLNVKVRAETLDAFYAITDKEGWVMGYTLQRAIEALQRELKTPQ